MNIEFVEIRNFRKLKSCRVDIAEKETVFVGANNSGKTSAMDALMIFLKKTNAFSTRDFTLSNWKAINALGKSWLTATEAVEYSIKDWEDYLPTLDIWISVKKDEIHYVSHLIPTLDWDGGLIGIRLRFEPKHIEKLHRDYATAYTSAQTVKAGATSLTLWPHSMWDFLERELNSHFEVCAYILNPENLVDPVDGVAQLQIISEDNVPLEKSPFIGLIKIDIINAQRGFSDVNTEGDVVKTAGNLSAQLREYYSRHLNPLEQPTLEDIGALLSIDEAKKSFDAKLKVSFAPSLKELEDLNYPGFNNPTIEISSQVRTIDSINHGSAVQFGVLQKDGDDSDHPLSLPEKYNGLGYQNLISMIFKLICFRDEWMKIGKSAKRSSPDENIGFEPLHLVLIEEPEAHLHAQVQQVFIRRAYNVLRANAHLGDKEQFTTQLIVSTHSNHIAHEIDFTSLRYFKRRSAETGHVPTSTVVNLSKTFGTKNDTTRFAIRYLKTTHCDLFFADAAILIEGSAEKILLPDFIKNYFEKLTTCYISLLEIGGSHAHKLRPLLEDLGITTLIVTDIDSIDPKNHKTSAQPLEAKGYESGNNTLRDWLPKKKNLDELLRLKEKDKQLEKLPIRVCYQYPVKINFNKKSEEVFPNTFEDALVYQNLEIFKKMTGTGILKKFIDAANSTSLDQLKEKMYHAPKGSKKAEFALDILLLENDQKVKPPAYIQEGLQWLNDQLHPKTTTK